MRNTLGGLLIFLGTAGSLIVDILSSIWLYNQHGLIWVIVCWVLFVPLIVIPFLAGYGLAFGVTLLLMWLGTLLRTDN